MKKIKDFYNRYLKKYVIKYKYYIILFLILLVVIIIPKRDNIYFEFSNKSKIEKICQLVTVKALYHNVGSIYQEPQGIPGDIVNYGYKKYWVEYDATVDVGIDCKEVKIKKSKFSNIVRIYLPKATILNEPIPDEDSVIEEYESGWFTKIDAESDKNYAYSKALENMKDNTKGNMELLNFAYERAKKIYENYIVSVGEAHNKKLIVEFIED